MNIVFMFTLQASEKENIALREKLTNIKIELSEATKNIMHTTGEIVTLQVTKEEQTGASYAFLKICGGGGGVVESNSSLFVYL